MWQGEGAMEMCSKRQVTNPWEMRPEQSERPCHVAGMFWSQVKVGTAGWWSPGEQIGSHHSVLHDVNHPEP